VYNDQSGNDDTSMKGLIEAQRRCSISRNRFERVVGSLLLAARLQKRLAALSDTAIGQLLFDHVWDAMGVFSPELTICRVATERLIDSSYVVQPGKENLNR
jgi:hypothetical protein